MIHSFFVAQRAHWAWHFLSKSPSTSLVNVYYIKIDFSPLLQHSFCFLINFVYTITQMATHVNDLSSSKNCYKSILGRWKISGGKSLTRLIESSNCYLPLTCFIYRQGTMHNKKEAYNEWSVQNSQITALHQRPVAEQLRRHHNSDWQNWSFRQINKITVKRVTTKQVAHRVNKRKRGTNWTLQSGREKMLGTK